MAESKALPAGWEIKKMSEVVTWGSGGTPKATEAAYYQGGTIPWLIIGDLNDGIVTSSASKITEEGLQNSSAKMIPPGTLLVAMYGSIGKLGITGISCCTNQAIAFAQKLNGVTIKYLFYHMTFIKPKLISMGKGGTQKNISQAVLKSLDVIVPPIPEQERIVARIEELFSQLDSCVDMLKKAEKEIELYQNAVIDEAIPYSRLSRIADCITEMGQGWSPKCEKSNVLNNDKWAVIKTTAIQPLHFLYQENKKLPAGLLPRVKHEISIGDILITRAGPKSRCGIACMVKKTKKRLLNCDKVYRIRVNQDYLLPEYLEYVLNSPRFIREINLCKTGGNDSGLNLTQDRFLEIKIPVPEIEQQSKIVTNIDGRLSECDNIKQTIANAMQQAEALRQSILKRAFEGDL